MSHVAGAARRDAEPGELVVAPEGSVDEHDVGCGEPAEHAVVQPGETGGVRHDAAARAVAEDEPAGLKLHVRPVQVARRVAARLERLDRRGSTPRAASPAPARASATRPRSSAPGPPARESRVLSACSTPSVAEYAHRRLRLAQEQKPCRVVDLRIGQQHAGDRRHPDAVQLHGLGAPRAAGARRARRLRETTAPRHRGSPATTAYEAARVHRTRGLARLAMAVPLRKPPAGGRAQNANAHVWHHRDAAQEAPRPRRALLTTGCRGRG